MTPIKAKVKSFSDYTISENKKSLMRFLGMARYYRTFCKTISEVMAPLTDLLKKNVNYQKSFDKVKNLLCLGLVLTALNFSKPFRLAVDTIDVGAGVVLPQSDDQDIEHPICYFFNLLAQNEGQNRRLLNWSLMLQEHNIQIEHVNSINCNPLVC